MSETILKDINLDSNLVIEASAGTGKTYTIKEIVTHLIASKKAKPDEILVLTFTEKATRELKERIRKSISENSMDNDNLKKATMNFESFNIFTIHGFCNNLIKNYPFDVKVPINAELSSIPYEIILTNILLKELPYFMNFFNDLTTEEIEKVRENIISLRKYICFEKGHFLKCDFLDREFLTSREVTDYIKESYKELNKVNFISLLKYYFILKLLEEEEEYKKKNWIITYDDMIIKVWNSLKINENFRKKISSLYKYIIIDEFQDTDLLQWQIFKTLKDENSDLKMILVGDPKQAIYGFRGGDIHTYFKAIEEIKPEKYILNINYRTTEEIINNLNTLFSLKTAFKKDKDNRQISWFSENNKLNYTNVSASSNIKIEPIKNIPPFNAYLIKAEKPKDVYNIWKNFVVSEIIKLLNLGMKKSDILILCRTTSNARDYEKELLKNGIKAFFYDREGSLFETKEAQNLKILLFALSFPEDLSLKKTLLVSEIFGFSLSEVNNFIESKEAENFNEIFAYWLELVSKRKWQELFDSVFFDTHMFDKLYEKYSTTMAKDIVYKYLQLSSIIKNIAEEKNMNIFSLFLEFDRMLREESAKTMLLDDDDFVKIMTIHASKGLESPIVFIGDGFTTSYSYDFYKYYDENKNGYYFVIKDSATEESKNKHKAEMKAEDERLFYVALTRAKYALYFGIGEVNKKGGAYIFCDWVKELVLEAKLAKELPNYKVTKYVEKVENIEKNPQFIDESIDFGRHSFMASFSSLHNQQDDKEIVTEIEISGEDEDEKNLKDDKLPFGPIFGTLIHEILEEIDFKIVKNFNSAEELYNFQPFYDFLNKKVSRFYEEKYYSAITELIFLALKNKISDFSLCEIKEGKEKRELNFYLRIEEKLYLSGVVDLIFEYNDKFYMVDWKTNLLETYEGDSFIEKVESSYGLQYRIYALATLEYMKNFFNEPEKRFGGIFYIYLKGLKKDSQSGIFYKKDIDIKDFTSYVLKEYNNFIGRQNA
ncbi:MAG: UvrD-helicase domain-containing protein [Brevinematales bacterium]|nr:UvrD-helicase domain-containing protein [Brevinematales bacterium]